MNAHSDVSDYDELEQRLRALGSQPVDSSLQSEHLTEMSYVKPATTLAHKARVAGALVAGIFIGSTGLAFAGALPEQAQNVAHEAFSSVGVDVPPGHARAEKAKADARARGVNAGGNVERSDDCPGWTGDAPRNRGHYMSTMAKSLRHIEDPTAREEAMRQYAESDCGKPVNAGAESTEIESEPNDAAAEGRARKGQGQANRPAGAGTQGNAGENRPPESFEQEEDTDTEAPAGNPGPPSEIPPEGSGDAGEGRPED